jgi:hypothetical protein
MLWLTANATGGTGGYGRKARPPLFPTPRPQVGGGSRLPVNFACSVRVLDKLDTFVKHADFNLTFDKEETTWRGTLNTRITITITTMTSS